MSETKIQGRDRISPHESFRRQRGLTLSALAVAAGRDVSEVSRVERGLRKPSATYKAAVSDALGVSAEMLFPQETETAAEVLIRRRVVVALCIGWFLFGCAWASVLWWVAT